MTAIGIRLSPGAKVPKHIHTGHKFILVLSGAEIDENATASKGTLMLSPPGTPHDRVVSDSMPGVETIVQKPVQFV